MSQPLPTGRFRWVDVKPDEISKLARRDKGYLLEVDVSSPRQLQDSHNDLPFMCEQMKINRGPGAPYAESKSWHGTQPER